MKSGLDHWWVYLSYNLFVQHHEFPTPVNAEFHQPGVIALKVWGSIPEIFKVAPKICLLLIEEAEPGIFFLKAPVASYLSLSKSPVNFF